MFAILKQISLIDLNFYNLTLLLLYCFFGGLLIKSHVWSIDAKKGYRQSIHFSNFLILILIFIQLLMLPVRCDYFTLN